MSKNFWLSGKQYRPWSDAALIWVYIVYSVLSLPIFRVGMVMNVSSYFDIEEHTQRKAMILTRLFRLLSYYSQIYLSWGEKMPLVHSTVRKQYRSRSAQEVAQSDEGICFTLIYSTVSNVFISGQRRPRSDCADAQSDLGLRCPHMPWRHVFSRVSHL